MKASSPAHSPNDALPVDELASSILTAAAQRKFREAVAYLAEAGPEDFRDRYPDLDDSFSDDGPREIDILIGVGSHPLRATVGWCDWSGEDEPGQIRDQVDRACGRLDLTRRHWDEERLQTALESVQQRGDAPPALLAEVDRQLQEVGLRLLVIDLDSDMYHFAPVSKSEFWKLDGRSGDGFRLGAVDGR
ncbi:hypothetical protein [Gulosibacter sp. 10]|uniref:DUF6630 family protein n=1 Tax=Gulosibacter sp. 10 TaxID=1255570 RepID=UPI00097F050F|nr:hypothetical protein [Gulosibacter sp. 10]SJM59489.1 hypothetical protein FM112_06550 [Gulosibacter sp. 10]